MCSHYKSMYKGVGIRILSLHEELAQLEYMWTVSTVDMFVQYRVKSVTHGCFYFYRSTTLNINVSI